MNDPSVLIIGYGSPIRGDDALGPLLADRLLQEDLPARTEIISRHILTADLVPDLLEHDRVIFLDAAIDGAPGTIRCRRLAADRSALSTMAHFLDPRELLAWCESLYGHSPETFLVSVCGASFDYASYRLSSEAAAAVPETITLIKRLTEGKAPR